VAFPGLRSETHLAAFSRFVIRITSLSANIVTGVKGRIRSAERVEAHLVIYEIANLLSAPIADLRAMQ
jgi:hypothetical protein